MTTITTDQIRWDVTISLSDAIDAGAFDARTWISGDGKIARVYVTRVEALGRGRGRKVTDCGFVEIRDGIDFSNLTRQSGTIEGLCGGIVFAAEPAISTAVSSPTTHEDALDQLETEIRKGPSVEAVHFG